MGSEKLLPCPMCAGEGEAVCLRIGEDAVASWVRCLSCGLRTAEIKDAYSDLSSAIAAWNTRAPADLRSALEAETIERCVRHLRERAKSFRKAAFDQGKRAGPMASSFEYAADEIEKSSAGIAVLAPTKGDAS